MPQQIYQQPANVHDNQINYQALKIKQDSRSVMYPCIKLTCDAPLCQERTHTHNDRGVYSSFFSLIKACCKCEMNSLLLCSSEWALQSDFFVSHVIITRYNESAARVHYQQDERETVEIVKDRQNERERSKEEEKHGGWRKRRAGY